MVGTGLVSGLPGEVGCRPSQVIESLPRDYKAMGYGN